MDQIRLLTAFAALLLAGTAVACGGSSPGPSPGPSETASSPPSPTFSAGPALTTQAAFPSQPPWTSEPSGVLAFVQFVEAGEEEQQDIHIVTEVPDGNEINLTGHPAEDYDPDISEDGSRIAFASNRSGSTQIWVMNSDGTDLRQLTDDGGETPRWSRDGFRIAFTRGGDIAVMNADGTGLEIILESQSDADDPCRAGAFIGGWSPDDSRITFYASSTGSQSAQVCTIAAAGSDLRALTADANAYNVEPVYSPDGTQIVYRAIVDGQHDIWILDLASGARRNLTDDEDLDIEPDWSPDGQWIVYGSLRPGEPHFDLYIMRPDGSEVRRITADPLKEANPVWAP